MPIKHRHPPALSAKIIPAFMLFLGIFAVCSCKKAPQTGEVFVTLKSDEIRFLGDLEVSFYGSDFPEQLEDFQVSVLDSAKAKALTPFEDEAVKLREEIASNETAITQVDKTAAETADSKTKSAKDVLENRMKNLANELQVLKDRRDALKKSIPDLERRSERLIENLEPFLQKEKELIDKAHALGNAFYADISKLITKINATIDTKRIPVDHLVDKAKACRLVMMEVKARSATEVLLHNDTSGAGNWESRFNIRYDEFWNTFIGDLVVIRADIALNGFKLPNRRSGNRTKGFRAKKYSSSFRKYNCRERHYCS